jgi:DNA-binding response OmpR family regulator
VDRVLVVSDSPLVREEVRSVFDGERFEVMEVDDGHLVRSTVLAHEPNLVVTDLQVGSMGGMAICMDLRLEESGGRAPSVAVLMLLDRRADVFLARRSGADGWVVKPLDPIRLRRAAAALLAGGRYEDEAFRPLDAGRSADAPAVGRTSSGSARVG